MKTTRIELDVEIPESYQPKLDEGGKALLRVPLDGEYFLTLDQNAVLLQGSGVGLAKAPRIILEKTPPQYPVIERTVDEDGRPRYDVGCTSEMPDGKYVHKDAFIDAMFLLKTAHLPPTENDQAARRGLNDLLAELCK